MHEVRTVEFKPNSRNVFFHILTKCNLRCRHCYINEAEHGARVLDADTMKQWLELFSRPVLAFDQDRTRGKIRHDPERISEETNVIFLGGEPTLNPALPDAVFAAKDMGFRSITVDTNGYLFHNFIEKVPPDMVDNLCFSLDGSSPEVNDAIRCFGSFKTCVDGIMAAISRGFHCSVIFTVSSLNIDDLKRMPRLLNQLGVRNFFIQVVGIRGRAAREGAFDLQVGYEKWQDVVPRVAHEAARMGIMVTYPKVFLEPGEEFICAGLRADNYFVFPNGRVYTCPLCEDYPIHSFEIQGDVLRLRPPITELDLFGLNIPEGCVMNRILHPDNIPYGADGHTRAKVACCMVKSIVSPGE